MFWLWLRRFLWLSAWTLWACFGWALYVVLPRAVNPPIVVLDPDESLPAIGFLEDEPTIVSYSSEAAELRLWDATTGAKLNSWPARWNGWHEQFPPCSMRYGKALVTTNPDDEEIERVEVLDLRSGARLPLHQMRYQDKMPVGFHESRPWIIGPEDAVEADGRFVLKISIFDLHNGKVVCSLPPKGSTIDYERERYYKPFFVPGTDKAVVHHITRSADGREWKTMLEVWSIPFRDKPEVVIPDVEMGKPVFSANGRVAWKFGNSNIVDGGPGTIDVLDLNTGEFVFSRPRRSDRKDQEFSGLYSDLVLSGDGRNLADLHRQWNLDTGELIPFPGGIDEVRISFNLNLVETKQQWEGLPIVRSIALWLGDSEFLSRQFGELWIVRNLNANAFEYCCNGPSLPAVSTERWHLSLDESNVRTLPARIRWEVIAVIQLPVGVLLVSIWGWSFRRRQKRSVSERASEPVATRTGQ